MKKPVSFIVLLIFSFCVTKTFASEKQDSTQLGYIQIKSPDEDHVFSLRNNYYNFKWGAPSNISDGQEYCYEINIAIVNKDENPDSIINERSVYYKTTDTLDYSTDWSISINDDKLNSSTHYAWQVKAYSGDSVMAKSDVYTFYGPPYLEEFKAGNHPVNVIRTTTNSLDSLCGIGNIMFKRNGERHTVKFNGIRVKRSGAELYLRRGRVVAKCKTPEINLKPERSINGNAYFMTDSILMDQEDLKISGYVKWEIPDSIINEDTDTIKSKKVALKYNNLKLLGSAYFSNAQTACLASPFNSHLHFSSSKSRFFISENRYYIHLTGSYRIPLRNKKSKQDTLALPFKDQRKISFYYENTLQTDKQVKLARDTSIMMNLKDYVIDLSDNKSPAYHKDSLQWKGISFDNFKISALKDSTFSFKINETFPEFTNTDSAKICHASLSGNDTIIDIQITTDTLDGTYNSFSALYDTIQIGSYNDSLKWVVKGWLKIPYLLNDKRIEIKSHNNRIQLAKILNDSSFSISPMHKYELSEISVAYRDTTIYPVIDHHQKNIELILPSDFREDALIMDFDFKGKKLQLNNHNLIKREKISLDSSKKDYNYSLTTYSIQDSSTNYDFKIYRPRKITLKVKNNDSTEIGGGKVKGDGNYKYNSKTTIKAIPLEGYKFIYWNYENGGYYSGKDSLTFLVKEDLNLVACFKEIETAIQQSNSQEIKIYPNPTREKLYFESRDYKIDQLKILDITGKKVTIISNLDNKAIIDMSGFDNGIYLIRIATDKGMITKKVIKK